MPVILSLILNKKIEENGHGHVIVTNHGDVSSSVSVTAYVSGDVWLLV